MVVMSPEQKNQSIAIAKDVLDRLHDLQIKTMISWKSMVTDDRQKCQICKRNDALYPGRSKYWMDGTRIQNP